MHEKSRVMECPHRPGRKGGKFVPEFRPGFPFLFACYLEVPMFLERACSKPRTICGSLHLTRSDGAPGPPDRRPWSRLWTGAHSGGPVADVHPPQQDGAGSDRTSRQSRSWASKRSVLNQRTIRIGSVNTASPRLQNQSRLRARCICDWRHFPTLQLRCRRF
jgi:hypothetical protein